MKTLTHRTNPVVRAGVASLAVLSLGVMTGCSESAADEEGTSVGDVQDDAAGTTDEAADEAADDEVAYDGAYDEAFVGEQDSYEGQTVTLTADIEEILTVSSFTLAGDGVDALVVVGAEDTGDLEVGSPVEVTGTLQSSFDLVEVEEETGEDLDDEIFAAFDQIPYVVADDVETSLDDAEGDAQG